MPGPENTNLFASTFAYVYEVNSLQVLTKTIYNISGEFDWGHGSKGDILGSYYYGYIITQGPIDYKTRSAIADRLENCDAIFVVNKKSDSQHRL